jgi:hypothetical protein
LLEKGEKMKVFISWSGEPSRKAAVFLKGWLRSVIQTVDPFVSSEDIRTGSRWFTEIGTKLEDTNIGILCLTPSNLKEPWILYEAGALSKQLKKSLLTSLLFGGLDKGDLECPLAQFQNILPDKEDIQNLILTINEQLDNEKRLSDTHMKESFDKWWPDLEKEIVGINTAAEDEAKSKGIESKRDPGEVMEEILELSRNTVRQLDAIKDAQSYNSLRPAPWSSGLYNTAISGISAALPSASFIAGDTVIKPGTGDMTG